jgi:hypothetical protein
MLKLPHNIFSHHFSHSSHLFSHLVAGYKLLKNCKDTEFGNFQNLTLHLPQEHNEQMPLGSTKRQIYRQFQKSDSGNITTFNAGVDLLFAFRPGNTAVD